MALPPLVRARQRGGCGFKNQDPLDAFEEIIDNKISIDSTIAGWYVNILEIFRFIAGVVR